MLKTIEVVFDGKAFVPTGPVDVPVGTRVNLALPDHGYPGPLAGAPDPENPPTLEQQAIWVEFLGSARSTQPDPPTLDEYLRLDRRDHMECGALPGQGGDSSTHTR